MGCIATLPTLALAQVKPVDAVDDMVHIRKGQTAIIKPLENDFTRTGNLNLDKVVLVNNGEATMVNNTIQFTPNPDFTGAAMINYTVCNTQIPKECDCGLIYVDVSENPHLDYQDMKVFVIENARTNFTLPKGYVLNSPNQDLAINFNSTRNEWTYRAPDGFKGSKYYSFKTVEDGQDKFFDVEFEVLPKQPQFISPDWVSTRIGKATDINVFANDDRNNIIDISYGTCEGGTIVGTKEGLVIFTPNLPKGGVAKFTYTVVLNNGEKETTQVVIFVSDYLPAKDQYRLVCNGETLVIQYETPLQDGYRFEIMRQPQYGVVSFHEYLEINGIKPFIGKNVLVYKPHTSTLTQGIRQDEFGVRFCDANQCSGTISVVVDLKDINETGDQCIGLDCVWPGDANHDGEVNIIDLFSIANALGQYGTLRTLEKDKPREIAIDWYAHSADNWNKTTYNGVDMKHADTDGNGVVTDQDVEALILNYNNHSTITAEKSVEDFAVDVQLIPTAGAARGGDLIEILVSVGSAQTPAYNAKGLNFTVKYDPQYIKENSIAADFKAYNWLSRYDAYLPLSKVTERGQLQAGMARSKGRGTSGHGEVGKVRAIVEDNVAGIRGNDKATIKFRLENGMMMKENGQLVALPDAEVEIPLILGKKEDMLKNDDLVMYPNPASDQVNFHINGVNTIEYVRLMDATGREITRLNKVNAKSASINVDASMRGFYLAEIMTEKGRIIKKLEIIR
jgi:hypothetical protein